MDCQGRCRVSAAGDFQQEVGQIYIKNSSGMCSCLEAGMQYRWFQSPFQLGIVMIQCSCTLQVKLSECSNCIAMGRTVPSPKGCAYVLETVNDTDTHPLPLCGREGGLSASRQSVSRLFSSAISLVYLFTPAHDLFRWAFSFSELNLT